MNNPFGLQRQKVQLYTIHPIEPADASQLEPEFCRMGDLRKLFGIIRSMAYLLIDEGKIKSVSLRRHGNAKGVRLVYVASVRQYLHSLLEAQSNQLQNGQIVPPIEGLSRLLRPACATGRGG